MGKIDLEKFLPYDKDIINQLYQKREIVQEGTLEDLLKLPLSPEYANNKLRIPNTYKFTEVKENIDLQKDLNIKISSNDIIKK